MIRGFIILMSFVIGTEAITCDSPNHSAVAFSTTDAFFHFSTTYIIEFNLQCANNVKDMAVYGVVHGRIYQAAVSEETSKHQISWQLEHSESVAQIFDVVIYDEDGLTAYRKAERSRDDISKVKSLFTVQLKHPGVSKSSPVASETIVTAFALIALYDVSFVSNTVACGNFRERMFAEFTTSVQLSVSNPVNVLHEARKLFHTTKTKRDISFPENDEKLKRVEEAIQKEHREAKPTGLFAKLKYYLKRYWYIAIPIHIVNCVIWFIVLYITVRSGLDVVALLKKCHVPDYVVDRVESIPSNAGVAVVAFLLYKIATPFRYATTLLLIQLSFPVFRRLGIMTAKEVKYKMRLKYTNKKNVCGTFFTSLE
ncbi:Translocon-associated protein subunit delta [Dirofilaria immitis]